VVQLQSAAGNAAVSALLAGRGVGVQRLDAGSGGCPPPPVPPPGVTADQDPKFKALKGEAGSKAKTAKAHPPAAAEAKKAQDAAVAPPDDKEAQAQEKQAEKMAGAKPGGFDKAKFIDAVTKAIEASRPKTNEEAKDFASSGKAGAVKSQVAGMVSQGKQDSAKDIAEKTEQSPDPGVAKDKPVTPLPPPGPPPQLAPPDPKKAVPDKAPAEQTQLGSTKCELNSKMAEADVTEEQLAKSNEPEFTAAVDAKKGAEQHAATAPAAARAEEATALGAATGQADAAGKTGVGGMLGARTTATGQARAAQSGAKGADEKERTRITGEIKKIFEATKGEVNTILGELDGKVKQKFDAGEQAARAAFEADHKKRMADYEDRIGYTEWLINEFRSTRPEVLQIFVDAAGTYEKQMRIVISDVADLIGSELDRAKNRIAKGRADVAKFVAEQPKALQGVAKEAAEQIGSQFDSLDSSVDAKQDALVDDLAAKYAEARENVDQRVKQLQEENKSWKDKAVDAVTGAIETILKLKDMLLGVLARAAGAVGKIIKDPIGFLGNFISAVTTGVMNFGAKIGEHLKKGLQGWLFGALAEAGIEIPDKFDLKGIVKLILSLLGLTWNAIRARIVKVIPEPVMKILETSVDFIQAILSEGVVGLWKWIAAKMSDLKEMVMGQIKDFVVTKIITAGITWLISLLNPAAAFIKACKMIYDAVMWFVDNAERLKDFVNSILDSVESIASGGVGAVASYIEKTLAKALPMVISGLASLLGLGGISDKIKKVLETIQKPVMSVVDGLVGTAVKYGKKLMSKVKKKVRGGDDSPEGKQQRLEKGVKAGVGAANRFSGRAVGQRLLKPLLGVIRSRYGLSVLEPVKQDKYWAVHGTVSRMTVTTTVQVEIDKADLKELTSIRQSSNNLLKTTTTTEVKRADKNKDSLNEEGKHKLTTILGSFSKVSADHAAAYTESDGIIKSRMGDPARAAALIKIHKAVKAECEEISEKVKDLTRGPEQLQKEADTLFKGMQTGLQTAEEILSEDTQVKKFVVQDPFLKGLGEDLKLKIEVMRTSLENAKRKVTSVGEMDTVRVLKKQSEELSAVAARAKRMSNLSYRVNLLATTIDNVKKKTENYGTKEDRTTEGALIFETESGEPWMSETGHLTEVKEMKDALNKVIAELEHLKALERSVVAKVDAELARARQRIVGFDRGLAVWENRKKHYPAMWDDNVPAQSRKRPGWPSK